MNKTTIIIKAIVLVIGFFIILLAMRYFSPAIGASNAVNQLNDSYTASASIRMWRDLTLLWPIAYGILAFSFFIKEIKILASFIK